MRLDLELFLPKYRADNESIVVGPDRPLFSLQRMPNGGASIRTDKSETEGKLLPIAIKEFLEDLLFLEESIKSEAPILRLGIFFQLDEIAFLSIQLPRPELKLIDAFGLEIEISAYPCLPDDDE